MATASGSERRKGLFATKDDRHARRATRRRRARRCSARRRPARPDRARPRRDHRHRHLRRSSARRSATPARRSSSPSSSPASPARSPRSPSRSWPRRSRSPAAPTRTRYATLGELVAWIIGWDLILEYAVSVAAVAVGWGQYFNDLLDSLFGFTLPDSLAARPARAARSTCRPSSSCSRSPRC